MTHDLKYYTRLFAGVFIASGAFLMLEHLIAHDGFDWWDIAGHETYGLVLVILGFIFGLIGKDKK
jgi:hypothetical protein